jgi:hypothetical protein
MHIQAIYLALENWEWIEEIADDNPEFITVQNYVQRSSCNVEIEAIYRVNRGFDNRKREDNVFLFFHGTPTENVGKIVANKFQVRPRAGNCSSSFHS